MLTNLTLVVNVGTSVSNNKFVNKRFLFFIWIRAIYAKLQCLMYIMKTAVMQSSLSDVYLYKIIHWNMLKLANRKDNLLIYRA